MNQRKGFTLIELMVATVIFITLIGVCSAAFYRLSNESKKTLEIIRLHMQADSMLRVIEHEIMNAQATTAVHLHNATDQTDETILTIMVSTSDNDDSVHFGDTESTWTAYMGPRQRKVDMIWLQYIGRNGSIYKAQSPIHIAQQHDHNSIDSNLRVLDTQSEPQRGVQANGASPTPQKEFKYFWGIGDTVHAVDSDGGSPAIQAEKIQVYRRINPAHYNGNVLTLIGEVDSPWRVNRDMRHVAVTMETGNYEALGAEAYAVRNSDNLTVNKDKLFLLGSDDEDGFGNKLYPGTAERRFMNIVFLEFSFLNRAGQVIDHTKEDDTLGDGDESIDVSGIDPDTGAGLAKRPKWIRYSCVLHAIGSEEYDEADYDNDNDVSESLATAIVDLVWREGHANRQERVQSFIKHARSLGYSCLLINQSVKMGL